MAKCCPSPKLCPLPDKGIPGGYWKFDKEDDTKPCCYCELDDGVSCEEKDPSKPHRQEPIPYGYLGQLDPCDCECNDIKAGKVDGNCPDNLPYFNSDICKCECNLSQDDCTTSELPNFDEIECECYCPLARILVEGGTPCPASNLPDFDASKCECYCETKSCDDPAKPDFDASICECYCYYDDPNGSNKCPENLPYLDSQKCECYCPDSVADSCTTEQYFDSTTCSCKNCAVPCEGANIRSTNCECICPLDLPSGTNCPDSEPYLDTIQCKCYCPSSVSSGCADDEVFDSATCACVYDVTKLSLDFIP